MNHTIAINYTSPTGTKSTLITATGDTNLEQDIAVAPSASAAETDLTITGANLQSFAMIATGGAMTVTFKTGTGGSGTTVAGPITVSPTDPFIWAIGMFTNPFSGNAGQVLVTSTPGGTLSIRGLTQN